MRSGIIFVLLLLVFAHPAQVIQIHSITKDRQTQFPEGYTLDGNIMNDNARLKLLEPANFGPSGTYPKSIVITDSYKESGSLTQISAVPYNTIFFFGAFNKLHVYTNTFTQAEKDSLYNWSKRGGKMIIAAGQTQGTNYSSDILNSKWGFTFRMITPTLIYGTAEGMATDIFNGPFGFLTATEQGGTMQGFLEQRPVNSVVLGKDALDNATLIMDCNTLDVIVADVDACTRVGGIMGNEMNVSYGPEINNVQDRFWTNLIVFMDRLQPAPEISASSGTLSANASYNGYQWYHNGQPLNAGTNPTHNAADTGAYFLEAKLNGGCVLRSNTITILPEIVDTLSDCEPFIPTAFSPDGNGNNDVASVYGRCIQQLEFKIYDRWGELIFETKDRHKGWDGTFKEHKLNSAVFAWTLWAKLYSGKEITKKGNITLLRR